MITQHELDKVNEASFYLSRILDAFGNRPSGDFDLSAMEGHKHLLYLLAVIAVTNQVTPSTISCRGVQP